MRHNFFHQALTFFRDPNPDIGLEEEKAIRLRERIGIIVLCSCSMAGGVSEAADGHGTGRRDY